MTAQHSGSALHRILIVDDNTAIHRDFQKVLAGSQSDGALAALESELFGRSSAAGPHKQYLLSFAESGQGALTEVQRAAKLGKPFSMAFVDMRMPGWDGIETTTQLLRAQPTLEVAICSAYMDYSWHDVLQRVQRPGLRLLRKPWTSGEVLGLVHELCERSSSTRGPVYTPNSIR
jgi:CheY-like chemotaxis protein